MSSCDLGGLSKAAMVSVDSSPNGIPTWLNGNTGKDLYQNLTMYVCKFNLIYLQKQYVSDLRRKSVIPWPQWDDYLEETVGSSCTKRITSSYDGMGYPQ